jgi:hypothetical protein
MVSLAMQPRFETIRIDLILVSWTSTTGAMGLDLKSAAETWAAVARWWSVIKPHRALCESILHWLNHYS